MEALAEASAAAVGGVVSSVVLHPLDTLKTAVQAAAPAADDEEADATGKAEKALVGHALGIDDAAPDAPSSNPPSRCETPTPGSPAPAPASAPPRAAPSTLEVARALYEDGGAKSFYRGVGISAVQSLVEKFCYFYAYSLFKSGARRASRRGEVGPTTGIVLGYLSDWSHLPVTLPIEVVCRKMQTARGRNPLPYVILNEVLAESGYKGLYRGWEAYLFLCWRPAVQYAIYDQLKALLLKAKRRKELTSAEAFLLGAVSRAIATIILFPYARAKVVAQAGKNASADRPEEERASASMVSVLVQIYRDEGVPGLFQGLGPELVRGVFSAALMLMVKEKLTASVKRALLG